MISNDINDISDCGCRCGESMLTQGRDGDSQDSAGAPSEYSSPFICAKAAADRLLFGHHAHCRDNRALRPRISDSRHRASVYVDRAAIIPHDGEQRPETQLVIDRNEFADGGFATTEYVCRHAVMRRVRDETGILGGRLEPGTIFRHAASVRDVPSDAIDIIDHRTHYLSRRAHGLDVPCDDDKTDKYHSHEYDDVRGGIAFAAARRWIACSMTGRYHPQGLHLPSPPGQNPAPHPPPPVGHCAHDVVPGEHIEC